MPLRRDCLLSHVSYLEPSSGVAVHTLLPVDVVKWHGQQTTLEHSRAFKKFKKPITHHDQKLANYCDMVGNVVLQQNR